MKIKYSFKKGLWKAVVGFLVFGLPFFLDIIPSDILNLTVGGILALGLNYLKIIYKSA